MKGEDKEVFIGRVFYVRATGNFELRDLRTDELLVTTKSLEELSIEFQKRVADGADIDHQKEIAYLKADYIELTQQIEKRYEELHVSTSSLENDPILVDLVNNLEEKP